MASSAGGLMERKGDGNLLTVRNCSVQFGGLAAVRNLTFALRPGELVGLIGPNGAGKTTVFNLITRVYPPSTGWISFRGDLLAAARARDPAPQQNPSGETPDTAIAERAVSEALKPGGSPSRNLNGICRTFQNIRLFQGLSVMDNVLVAANSTVHQGMFSAIFRTTAFYDAEMEARTLAAELLEALRLTPFSSTISKNLPYGAQRRLEIARALATRPELLLLDEPAAGMNPQESDELMEMIRWIQKEYGLTILLIEHDMKVVMGMCERILVMENGALIAEGAPARVRNDPAVIAAYLGEPEP